MQERGWHALKYFLNCFRNASCLCTLIVGASDLIARISVRQCELQSTAGIRTSENDNGKLLLLAAVSPVWTWHWAGGAAARETDRSTPRYSREHWFGDQIRESPGSSPNRGVILLSGLESHLAVAFLPISRPELGRSYAVTSMVCGKNQACGSSELTAASHLSVGRCSRWQNRPAGSLLPALAF